MTTVILALPLLPLLVGALLLLGGRRLDRVGPVLAVAAVCAAFAIAAGLFVRQLGAADADRVIARRVFSWVPVEQLHVDFGVQLDQLSICFVLLITGVGALIHIYSLGYMRDDPGKRRFFAYLNLFVAAMLILVLSNNYLGLYLGWEGVGLTSYLLIGFWQHKPSAATAAKKAFVVNRVGDVGLTVALMIMFVTFRSVQFGDVFAGAPHAESSTLNWLGLVLLLAACGKSAQVPLQSWLGDAMEGPTPVSALIHAATMVTAGVYLIARSAPVFDHAQVAANFVVAVGAITLLFGAIIGCAKDDIKKALAASTMSQIGYMVLAVGLGPAGYAAGLTHLLAHGFFKAGLFLGAGAIMHAMAEQVDMRRYGGLRTVMPITFATFGLAYLAIIGVPPFSGFFSKDQIIEAAFAAGGAKGAALGTIALAGAGLTAFYMTRVMLMTFFGERRWEPGVHPHEAPWSMTGPMIVLAVGSVAAGAVFTIGDGVRNWVKPVVGFDEHHAGPPTWAVIVLSLLVVAIGFAVAYRQYAHTRIPAVAPAKVSALTVAARRDLYGDTVNEAVFERPGRHLTRVLVFLDAKGIDGLVNTAAAVIGGSSARLRKVQTGYARSYALITFIGAVLLVGGFLWAGVR